MECFTQVEEWLTRELAAGHLTTGEVGDLFEVFAEALLRTYPVISAREVWPHGRIPERVRDRLQLGSSDRGVDGAFLTHDDELGAYQVKFRSRTDTLSWRDLSTFVGLSEFADRRLVVTTAGGIATEALSRPNLSSLLGSDLRGLPPEDLSRIFMLIRAGIALPREQPRREAHQIAAVRALVDELTANPRATALMACGSGKTFVGLWVAQDLLAPGRPARILILVPSLALVAQTLKAWSLAQPWGGAFHSCCVCSDETIADDDEIELNPNELPIPVTTQPGEIRRFLSGPGVRTVFSTYQSSERVREAVEDMGGFQFDLAICDEAHRTARAGHSDFTLPLNEEHLPIRRRLFMTATRRIYSQRIKNTAPVHSMDDVPLYGQIAYSLNFRQAADLGIICPYKLLVSVVTRAELAEYIRQTGVQMDRGVKALEEVAGRYALSRAMTRLGLRKAFTFHKTVNSAASFVARGEFGLERFLPDFTCLHVSGAMRTAERETRMIQFKGEAPAIMSNARCLNEGIDVPAVDLVAFMDPKRSMVDIVQAIGRALRKPRQNSTKAYGYILLPVYLDADKTDDIDSAVKGSEFNDVWYVLRALMAQDLQLTETVEKLRVAQLRNKATDADDSLSGFLQVIGSTEVEDILRSAIRIQVVEELGEFARLYARDPQPYVAIEGMEEKVKAFLERHFGREIRINRKRGETVDGLVDFSISCSNSKVYIEKFTFFNAVTPEDRTRRYFVIWSKYSQYGFVIPTSVFDGFLTVENSTRKPNEKYDWNVLTTYGPHGDFLKFKNELLDVTDYRVDYLSGSEG